MQVDTRLSTPKANRLDPLKPVKQSPQESSFNKKKIKELSELARRQNNRGTVDQFPYEPLEQKPVPMTDQELQKIKEKIKALESIGISTAVLQDMIEGTDFSAERAQQALEKESDVPLASIKNSVGYLDDYATEGMGQVKDTILKVMRDLKIVPSIVSNVGKAFDRVMDDQTITSSQRKSVQRAIDRLAELERAIDISTVPSGQKDKYATLKDDTIPYIQGVLADLLDFEPASKKGRSGGPSQSQLNAGEGVSSLYQAPSGQQMKDGNPDPEDDADLADLRKRLDALQQDDNSDKLNEMIDNYNPQGNIPVVGNIPDDDVRLPLVPSQSSQQQATIPMEVMLQAIRDEVVAKEPDLPKSLVNQIAAAIYMNNSNPPKPVADWIANQEGISAARAKKSANKVVKDVKQSLAGKFGTSINNLVNWMVGDDPNDILENAIPDDDVRRPLETSPPPLPPKEPKPVLSIPSPGKPAPQFMPSAEDLDKSKLRPAEERQLAPAPTKPESVVSQIEKRGNLSASLITSITQSLNSSGFGSKKDPKKFDIAQSAAFDLIRDKYGPNASNKDIPKKTFTKLMNQAKAHATDVVSDDNSVDDRSTKKSRMAKKKITGKGIQPRHKLTMTKDGKFGALQFNMKKWRQMQLHAKKGRKIVAEGPLSPDLHDLLSKKFNSRRNYSQASIDAYRKLAQLAGVPINVSQQNGKAKILQGRVNSKAQKGQGTRKNTKYVYYDDPNQLIERLHVITGSIDAGNVSPSLKDEASHLMDLLKDKKVITEAQYISLQESLL